MPCGKCRFGDRFAGQLSDHCRGRPSYAILRRSTTTGGYWQFIAGGGHIGESRMKAARREALEEAAISSRARLIRLTAQAMLPVKQVCGFHWGPDVFVIPEFCFGIEVIDGNIRLSREHSECRWVSYQSAMRQLHWDSNRTALWELNLRLRRELDRASTDPRHRDQRRRPR